MLLFDKRGMGLSDRVTVGTLEERMDDVRAVMDAAGSERAALLGISEGAALAMLFAATYPERTAAMILCGGEVKEELTEDWPYGKATAEEFEASLARVDEHWLEGSGIAAILPSRTGDARLEEWFARMKMQSASPSAVAVYRRMAFFRDVRHVAPAIHVPTLVVHEVGDQICHVENARFLARTIDGARLVELPGADHLPWGEHADEILAEIRGLLTGVSDVPDPERVLATVLFTDIVGSTQQARAMGDRRWRDLLEAHHELVRTELVRFGGREIDTAGDGFLAAFDGPARALRCARSVVDGVTSIGLEVRAGVHTGECEVIGDKLAGLAVHVGARIASQAAPGEVLVSSTVGDLIAGSGIDLVDRGLFTLKDIEGERRLFALA